MMSLNPAVSPAANGTAQPRPCPFCRLEPSQGIVDHLVTGHHMEHGVALEVAAALNAGGPPPRPALTVSKLIADVFGPGSFRADGRSAVAAAASAGPSVRIDAARPQPMPRPHPAAPNGGGGGGPSIEETLESWGLKVNSQQQQLDENENISITRPAALPAAPTPSTSASSSSAAPPPAAKAAPSRNKAIRSGVDWYDRCIFKCPHCPLKFFKAKKLKKHAREKHGAKGLHKTHSYLVRRRQMRCLACGKELLCERKTIQRHLKAAHGRMSVKQYEQQYRNNSSKETTAADAANAAKAVASQQEQGQGAAGLNLLKALSEEGAGENAEAPATGPTIKVLPVKRGRRRGVGARRGGGASSASQPAPSPDAVDAWCNACRYHCRLCARDPFHRCSSAVVGGDCAAAFGSHAATREHLHAEHVGALPAQTNLASFVEQECLVRELRLICAVCRRDVRRDREDLAPHFRRHGLSVEQYYQKHRKYMQ